MNLSRQNLKGKYSKQSGVATVETAIVILLLMVLLLASAELGRIFNYSNEFTKSVRNAARYVSNHAVNSASVMDVSDEARAKAKYLLIYGNTAGSGVSIFPGLEPGSIAIIEDDPYISVIAQWEYITLFGGTLPALGVATQDNYTLKAGVSMRALE